MDLTKVNQAEQVIRRFNDIFAAAKDLSDACAAVKAAAADVDVATKAKADAEAYVDSLKGVIASLTSAAAQAHQDLVDKRADISAQTKTATDALSKARSNLKDAEKKHADFMVMANKERDQVVAEIKHQNEVLEKVKKAIEDLKRIG